MSQAKFDEQVKALNDELDKISGDLQQWISDHQDIDTSALDAVVTRLDTLDTDLVPPTPAPVVDVQAPTETAPTQEVPADAGNPPADSSGQ